MYSIKKPFSKAAYLEFVRQWKQLYKNLSNVIRAWKLIEKENQRRRVGVEKLSDEKFAELTKLVDEFQIPTELCFVELKISPRSRWTEPTVYYGALATELLELRKEMKEAAQEQYLAQREVKV